MPRPADAVLVAGIQDVEDMSRRLVEAMACSEDDRVQSAIKEMRGLLDALSWCWSNGPYLLAVAERTVAVTAPLIAAIDEAMRFVVSEGRN